MKKTVQYLTFSLITLTAALCCNAKGVTDFLINPDSMENYLLRFNHDTFANTSKILFQKGTIAVDKRVNGKNIPYQAIEYKFEKLTLINNNEDIDKLTTLSLPYSSQFKVQDIEARIYNREKGKLIVNNIKRSDLIKEKLAENVKVVKLNLPNIKKGSVIYYTFTYKYEIPEGSGSIQSYIPISWDFQNEYYTGDSYFDITIDNDIRYDQYNQNVSFPICSTFDELITKPAGLWIDQQKTGKQIVFHRKDIEAMKEEPLMGNSDQYLEKITFRVDPVYSIPAMHDERPSTWEKANHEYFYASPYLGRWIFKPNDTLSFVLNKINQGKTDNLDLAKAIYKYVRDSIKCTGFSPTGRIWAATSLKNILKHKKGSISDKNILLSALLRKAGFKSYPVVLSTRDDIQLSDKFFDIDLLDYTLSYVELDDKSFFLDASSQYLPFGVLKPTCYNEFAWLINEKGIPLSMKADNLLDKNINMATLKPTERKGVFSLKLEQRMGNVSGPLLRELWNTDSIETKKILDNDIEQLKYKIKIKGQSITNMYNPDTPLIITYNLEIELDESGNYIYLNPIFKPFIELNPFKDLIRKYPIKFPHAANSQFILKFNLPERYTLEDLNEQVNLNFKDGAMKYTRTMQYDPGLRSIALIDVLSNKTTKIAVEDYQELRSFYEAVVSEQHKSIVLKKVD